MLSVSKSPLIFLIAMTIALSSCCCLGERAQQIDLPSAVIQSAVNDAVGDPLIDSNSQLPSEWWTIFRDEQLTSFIQTSFTNYPSLQAAYANIRLAAANATRVRSKLFPSIIWGGDVSRQKFSETGIIPFKVGGTTTGSSPTPATGGINGIPVYFTQYETELTLTYDFDVWGKNRNALRAALGEVQARVADEAFSRLQLGISLAQVYFQLQILYKRQEIGAALVKNQTQYFDALQNRVNSNLENALTLHGAQYNVVNAKQQLLQVQANIAVNEYQLKTYLAGNFDEEIVDIKIEEYPLPKVPLPRDLPLHLIANRPDITAQLWLIQSAGNQIEVAKKGFYPDFNLTAFYGYQTIHLPKLFQWPSSYFNIDPAFTLPIFDGGLLVANLRGSEIDYDLAIFQYNEMVLNAAKEVLQGIAVLRNSEQQQIEVKNKLNLQEEVYKLTNLRVKHNLNSSLDYLAQEEQVLLMQDQEAIAEGNTIQAILSLIKALGGGFTTIQDCGTPCDVACE